METDTNRALQSLNLARGLKFRIQKEEGLYYPCSENKGADQLRGYREADLHLCFCIYKIRFSHDEAQFIVKLVFTGVYIFFLVSVLKQLVNDCSFDFLLKTSTVNS